MLLALQLDMPEILGSAAALMAAVAASARIGWAWVTKLIERLQDEATKTRDQFTSEIRSARADFISETGTCRKEFLEAMNRIEDKRSEVDGKVLTTLSGIREILRERGIRPPGDTANLPKPPETL